MEELLKTKLELAKQGFITLYLWEKEIIKFYNEYRVRVSSINSIPDLYIQSLLGGDWELVQMQTMPRCEFEKGFYIKVYSQLLFEYHENLARIEKMSREEYFIEQLQIAI